MQNESLGNNNNSDSFSSIRHGFLKYFYLELMSNYRNLFSYLVHYDRFVTLIKFAFPALVCLLKTLEGTVTEYLFIDATPMAVCHNLREKRHKVFKELAKKSRKCYFYNRLSSKKWIIAKLFDTRTKSS